jgi:hypothetical protein
MFPRGVYIYRTCILWLATKQAILWPDQSPPSPQTSGPVRAINPHGSTCLPARLLGSQLHAAQLRPRGSKVMRPAPRRNAGPFPITSTPQKRCHLKFLPIPPIVCAPKTPPPGSRARSGMHNPPETPPMEHCKKRYSLIAAAAFTPQKPSLAPISRPKRYPDSFLLEAPQSSAREDPRWFHNRHPRLNWCPLAGLCHPY